MKVKEIEEGIFLEDVRVPMGIFVHPDLRAREKLLFSYIRELTEKNGAGYCNLSNAIFGKLLGVHPLTISLMLRRLEERNLIIIEYISDLTGREERRIYINESTLSTLNESAREVFQEISEISKVVCRRGRPRKEDIL